MRLHILSDLHLEVAPFEAPVTDADLVILAGDIDNGTRGMDWARKSFPQPVLYLAGNHEAYEADFDQTEAALAATADDQRLFLFDCTERVIDGVRFLGCTLWTDYSLGPHDRRAATIEASRTRNPDYKLIRRGERAFAPEDAIELCNRHLHWLEAKLEERHAGPTVVMTHFAPHPRSIAPAYQNHPANPGFIVDLDRLMGRAELWIHGHTHTAFDYHVHGTRVVCNPRGYPHEATGFAPDRVISL